MIRLSRRSAIVRWGAAFLSPHIVTTISALPRYLVQWALYKKAAPHQRLSVQDSYPCLTDRVLATPFDPHYFFQAAWLARRLQALSPPLHVDVGSSIMMVNMLSAGVKTVFVDYRPLRVRLSNFNSVAGDVVRLPFCDASVGSLSCLHVIEHVGLGRYGDSLDPDGSRAAAVELQRVLQPRGRLFLSAPVGRERVCFNAHRVHLPTTIQSYFQSLDLVSFSLVDDSGRFTENVHLGSALGLEYGCGLFEFTKPRA